MSSIRGLLTIFFSPGETFASSGPRSWVVPMIAAAVIAALMNIMIINVMGMGTITRNQLESSTKLAERLGPEKINQMAQEAENSSTRKIISYIAPMVVIPIILLIAASIVYGLLLVTGGTTTFPAVLTAHSWATYVVLVVTALGSAIFLAAVKDYSGVNPQQMVMANASIFLDKETTPAWLRAIASGIDALAIWSLYLQTVGIRILSSKVSTAQAAGVVICVYVVWILCKAGWATMFG